MNTRRSDPRDIVDDSIWFSTSSARRGKHTADAGRAAATVRVMIVAALVSAVSLVIWWS